MEAEDTERPLSETPAKTPREMLYEYMGDGVVLDRATLPSRSRPTGPAAMPGTMIMYIMIMIMIGSRH